MNNDIRNAVEVLKRAVLQALYENHILGSISDPQSMTFNEIHESIGIERIPNTRDYFVHGILLRLWQEDGHAERVGRGRWAITQQGIATIEGEA